ncbi:unnamed protein product [Alopecurus aequalis]
MASGMGHRPVLLCLSSLVVLLLFCRNAAAAGNWCVANPTATDALLLSGLNWACGQGGVDCGPINIGGTCYIPNTVHDHASYAFNAYYQKNPGPSCDFGGSAVLTYTDPSSGSCKYPSRQAAISRKIGGHTLETEDIV